MTTSMATSLFSSYIYGKLKNGLEVTQQVGRNALDATQAAIASRQVQASLAANVAQPASSSSNSVTATSAPGILKSLGSKLWQQPAASTTASSASSAAAAPSSQSATRSKARQNDEEKEQRKFLIPPVNVSRVKTKVNDAPDKFSFDDSDDDDGEDSNTGGGGGGGSADTFSLTPSAVRSSLFTNANSARMNHHSTATNTAASSTSASAASSDASLSSSSSSSSADAHFASLPKMAVHPVTGSASAASSAKASPRPTASLFTATSYDPVQSSQLQLTLHEQEQDAILEDMSHAIQRLTHISNDIGKELKIQEAELDALDESLDDGASSLDIMNKKMQKLLKRSDKNHMKIICCLILVVVVLLFMIFFL